MKIQVCLTTYERADSLQRLLLDLERESATRVCVYDDCSPSADYAQCIALIKQRAWTWQRAPKNHGRVGYPRLIDGIWQDLGKGPSADLYVFLQDDNRLCSLFFQRLVETWQSIDSSSKGAMMLLTDDRDTIWGAAKGPKSLGKADRIGWVDSMYVAPARTLHDFQFRFPVIPPRPAGLSSGTGLGLTNALRRLGRTMYRANPSLVAHVSIPSLMHGQERVKHPLHAKNYIDGEVRHDQLLRGES